MESSEVEVPESTGRYHQIITAAIDLISGAAGGANCVFVGQPLDTVKVKMQTNSSVYKNSLDCFKKTFVNDGLRGLYAGTVPSLAANVAENAVLFCAYGACQTAVQKLLKKNSELSTLENAFAGCLAAFFSSVALCPTELVKCRLQADKDKNGNSTEKGKLQNKRIGPSHVVKTIFKQEGLPGFFRGFAPTLAREMPGYFCMFGSYELCRVILTPEGKSKDQLGLIQTTLCGGIGGICFWLAVFPLDLIKSRAQISSRKEPMMNMIRNVIRNEGIKALYKGLGPTLLRTFPASGAMFATVEYSKKLLHYILD
ncbi:mitochondrial ornithine transporter 1-like [Uloborus diversus]|uniref:mitochondrial ornithine transporter 1-like n=1 Tax=Uloborus diversus TaxID=327109 RepID=UPI0024094C0E|nr:mitochondrial ornithine transporter 1-like [Uloborus diversus]